MPFHVHDIFINSNQIKFKIDINNDELLKTIDGNIKKEKKQLIVIGSAKQHKAQVNYNMTF